MVAIRNHLFCFGLGYCAKTLTQGLAREQWSISGTSRTPRPATSDLTMHAFDGGSPIADAESVFDRVTHILASAAPSDNCDPVLNWHSEDIAKMTSLKWVGYLSTTGVYGDTDGAVVDETAQPQPSSKRSQNRLQAELAWMHLLETSAVPVHIFRLPGIYGPGRSALDQVLAGKARRIDKPGHQFSRIHVDDIARTLIKSIDNPNPGRIYNVCDDEAASPADVTAFACQLLQKPVPDLIPFEIARQSMSPMALSFWQDNRRVTNGRIKSELAVQLRYPTYREGLTSIYGEMTG